MAKKRILYQSDFSLAKTGFGRCSKALLSYLYSTGKYDIYHYCCGMREGDQVANLSRTPWKSIGTLPSDDAEMQNLNKDPEAMRLASYGSYSIDKVIKEIKPDVYIAAQDIWGVDFAIDKPWFKNISSVIWTTLDSLPILPTAIKAAKKVDNLWIWSNFATKALNEMGHEQVKTMHGPVDSKHFHRLKHADRLKIRERFNIDPDTFVCGFVFRNQLRKSVPNLLEGYALWKEKYKPDKPTALLLHTHFGEGWGIEALAKEYGVPTKEILTTYICRACKNYEVTSFDGVERWCRFCGSKGSQITTNVSDGVTEDQLNDVYNLMDLYVHPFTSGGQEYPIQEAKLAELITLVTNYSCGEEMCEEGAYSLPLDWSEYREHGTQFKKASTIPSSIAEQMNKVFKMNAKQRKKMGQKARQWALDNFSIEVVGKKFEDFIDSAKPVDYESFKIEGETKDPSYDIPTSIYSDVDWIIDGYKGILKMEVDKENQGVKHWLEQIERGMSREDVEKHFKAVAAKDNESEQKKDFADFLDKDDEGKRILYVMPSDASNVFLSTSLFESINEQYPNYNLYVATQPENEFILDGNEYVHKVIPYIQQMDDLLWLEGIKKHKGYFEIAFLPHLGTERSLDYLHNGKDKIAFDIKG